MDAKAHKAELCDNCDMPLIREDELYQKLDESRKAGMREVVGFVQPLLGRINDLVSDIRGDWTDPRTECRAIFDIINQWQDKLKVWFKDNPELLKEWGLEGE